MDNTIYIYKYNGEHNTQGELDTVIFYDTLMATSFYTGGDIIGKIQFDTSVISTSPATPLLETYSHTRINDTNKIFTLDNNGIEKIDIASETTSIKSLSSYDNLGSGSLEYLFVGTSVNKLNMVTEILSMDITTQTNATNTSSLFDTAKDNVFTVGTIFNKLSVSTETSSTLSVNNVGGVLKDTCSLSGINYGYIFGGKQNTNALVNTIQRFNFDISVGVCEARSNMVAGFSGLGGVVAPDETMVITGGDNFTVQKFNPVTSTNTVLTSAYPKTVELLRGNE